MKGLFSLLLTTTGCLAAPMAPELAQLDFIGKDKDHTAIVELTRFVRDHLALDVEENRRCAERSNNQTEVIANAILKHVNDLNRDSTTKFEKTLKKLQETIEKKTWERLLTKPGRTTKLLKNRVEKMTSTF